MDTFAHAAWSFIVFKNLVKVKELWLAIFFGIMPDLFSWTIYLFYSIIKNGFKTFGAPQLDKVPQWAFTLYGITHSILLCGGVLLIVYFWFGSIPWWLFAWPMHILIDIPTHSRNFLPTPFLWPISDYAFPGFSWGVSWFMILNWTGILISLIYIFFFSKK